MVKKRKKKKGKKSRLKGEMVPNFSPDRSSLGHGVGMIPLGQSGRRNSTPMPQHAIDASKRRAIKSSFLSDKSSASFRRRAEAAKEE